MFLAAWVLLYLMYRPKTSWENIGREEFRKEYRELGKPKMEEKIILTLFIILALLWVFRAGFDLGSLRIPGWARIFRVPDYINDGTVAIFISLLLFMIPSKTEKGERLMNWKTTNKIPWNIVLLFGGGFALAKGFVDSGLSLWFGNQMAGLSSLHPLLLMLIVVTMISFLTELTSNTATAEMILPILAGLSVAININPLLLMIPSTIAASLAFMLPVATPPNAIAFGTGHLEVRTMVRTGFWLNMTAVVITTLMVYFLGSLIFDIEPGIFPDWAVTTKP
jgi:sodium-dependent dicarboxylate transporter 2/3/5